MPVSPILDRKRFLALLEKEPQWDVIIIGGGATGLGIAVDSASRGYKTLLLEAADFAKGTSSRSTKLVHGGVRYLAQGDISLVYEALNERGLLLKNAPHLVKKQSFIIPCYSFFSKLKFLTGLKLYDWLSGRASFGSSKALSRDEVLAALPGLEAKDLVGGVEYFDGQFDDARLAINLAQTAAEAGGVLLNYCKVVELTKEASRITGVKAVDIESDRKYIAKAKVVINATGVFVDDIMQMDVPEKAPMVKPSQGIHLVFDQSFLPGNKALMIPETADGRVLFAIPWHGKILVGTTDTPLDKPSAEPAALQKEIAFILDTLKQYFTKPPARSDVLSIFAGLRPLAAPQKMTEATKEISRSHKIIVSDSGLITITGGKWTTYRKMAEDTVDKAIKIGALLQADSVTKSLYIHGYSQASTKNEMAIYGSDAGEINNLISTNPSLSAKLSSGSEYTEAEVVWAVRSEMARTVEDVLARRTRLLFLDAQEAVNAAPRVATLIAKEFGHGKEWEQAQVEAFRKLAQTYLVKLLSSNDFVPSSELSSLTN